MRVRRCARASDETGSLADPLLDARVRRRRAPPPIYGSEDEGVGDALANVLAHDAYAPQRAMVAAVRDVTAKHRL